MKKELKELIGDLKEQISFLSELGVDGIDAEFPDVLTNQPENISFQETQTEISRERLEKFVPSKEILQSFTDKDTENEPEKEASKPKSKSRLLDSVRLSRLPAVPKRNSGKRIFQSEQKTKNISEENNMAKSDLSETLFGDISEKLPETGETLEDIRQEIGSDCSRCELCKERTQVVHSTGNQQADLMFVGEAPGADEDAQGKPFVGRAGKLLTKIIEAIGMKREEVFIGNINRCRPPGNRQPTPEESATCKPFLLREISVVRPKVIVVLGNTAMKNLLDTKMGITKMRGKFVDYYGVKVMPTFHPAYLLRDPRKKREVWEDMKLVKAEIEKSNK